MTRSDINSMACVGFVGLGALGLPMAANLCRAGYKLRVHTRSRTAEGDPSLVRAITCSTPQEAAEECDALMVCVSDDAAVEDVLFGQTGASNKLKPGSIVIDFSTIAPETSERLAANLAELDIDYLDAPVTGGTEGATAGRLTVLVGGKEQSLAKIRPILEVIGESIHHFGAVGKGQQVKAINQVLIAGCYAALAEAIALGQSLNLPMDFVVKALQHGAAESWALKFRSGAMLAGDYPLGFKMALHQKDLGIALNTAKRQGLELPVTQQVSLMEQTLIEQGYGEEDISALHRWIKIKEN